MSDLLNNCYFQYIVGGAGDCIIHFFKSIILSKKNIYDKIYLLCDDNRSNRLYHTFFKRFIIPSNLFIVSDYEKDFNNSLSYLPYKYYFDKFDFLNPLKIEKDKYDKYKIGIQKIDNNFYYSNFSKNCLDVECDFNKIFYNNNIFLNDIYNINLNLSNEDNILNNKYYKNIIEKIGLNYICIFDDANRYNSIFSFKYYKETFNPNNYPIIYFTDNFNCLYNQNTYCIKDLIGSIEPLYYYHDIISNSKEVHFTNSFPVNYFRFIFNILKDKFENVIKYIYPRYIFGLNSNLNNKFDININSIYTHELGNFNNFKFICPINYFLYNNSILDKVTYYDINKYNKISNDGIIVKNGNILEYKTIDHFFGANKCCNVIKNKNYYHNINYFNKFIINLHSLNILGIVDYNDLKKKINPVYINLNENKINHLWNEIEEKNINFFQDCDKINDLLLLFLKNTDEYLNFIFLKSELPFFIIINERDLDNNFNIISNNNIIQNYNEKYAKILDILMENKNISYIFPFINDLDFELYKWFYSNFYKEI